MANTMRWRYGDTKPVMVPVPAGKIVEIGDLVFKHEDHVLSAADFPPQDDREAAQAGFNHLFLGVAMQPSPASSTEPIRIATSGVFEYDALSTPDIDVADLVGVDVEAKADQQKPLSQSVAKVDKYSLAIGRAARRVLNGSRRVLVEIVSTIAQPQEDVTEHAQR